MKKLVSLGVIFLLLASTFLTSASSSQASAQNSEKVVFFDDFEKYSVGTFPSAGGWEIVWNGRGNEYQAVTDATSVSGSKSLKLEGVWGWSCVVQRKFSYTMDVIGYEVYVKVDEYGKGECTAKVGFFNRHAGSKRWAGAGYYGWIFFTSDGKITAGGKVLQTYRPKTWYKVRVVYNTVTKKFNVWINDRLKGENLEVEDPGKPNAMSLQSAWATVKCYFDDVKVFEYSAPEYYLKVVFSSSVVNGQSLNGVNPEITVRPEENLKGYLEVVVDNNRGGPWITPVIGTCSWGREITGQNKGWFTTMTSDAPTGKSRQRFNFELKAPANPGTYYIGVFAGWMYNGDEVASNDHPPQYGNGNDVWDMKRSNWEEVIAKGHSLTGPYHMPGRAIRVSVAPTIYLQAGSATVRVGMNASVPIEISKVPRGLSGYKLAVSVDPGVARIVDVKFPDFGLTSTSSLPDSSVVLTVTDIKGVIEPGSGRSRLATLIVQGLGEGESEIGITVKSLDDDDGNIIQAEVMHGKIVVKPRLPPLPGANPPTDLDGDGLFEDMNGNGRLDFNDVVLFFRHMDFIKEKWPVQAADFNGNGRIDFNDIVRLFKEV